MLINDSTLDEKSIYPLSRAIVGNSQPVQLLDGTSKPYINFDNAASTPTFISVKQKFDEALNWYSSVHRGAGFKSLLSTRLYEQSRQSVAEFVGADLDEDCVIFCTNTSAAINMLANCMQFGKDDIILTTILEHHSNDLPWRPKCKMIYVGLRGDGSLAFDEFKEYLMRYAGQVKLVSVSGASNVTGFVSPIYDLAELAHQYGAKIFVDCAQLAPHRSIQMGKVGSPRRLDFIAFSAHKMYAPYGSGALIGRKEFFSSVPPDYRGGGTIEVVTLKEVYWTEPPERNEVGSPNVIGAVALAASIRKLTEIGMEAIAAHEAELTRYTLAKMNQIDNVRIYGSNDPDRLGDRLGVITFAIKDIPHGKIAAILNFEGGIAVRNGCFCAHPYVLKLLGISEDEFDVYKNQALAHNRAALPGMVRASFGCYNTTQEVDEFIEMLKRIVKGQYRDDYTLDIASGSYTPRGYNLDVIDQYIHI